ncbi:protein THEM6 isoform X1 [Octopus bimaculoides]|uniref:Protein THEM6 n=1 Tax=Octopus bimaculoides TaxID=37653 RepID=A0A0L8FTP2_OCTBM|nr:protein THEM6 isoform X1 [Octopus bimaculoides]|eukprot:XP_014787220.1 PREDICTED: protein THEM6-like isoform X1 [Octopus bimaculoides]
MIYEMSFAKIGGIFKNYSCYIVLAAYVLFDVHYFIRTVLVVTGNVLLTKLIGRRDVMEEDGYKAICLTTDMDFQWHMNNARYLRECDWARFSFWIRNSGLKTRGRMLVKASTIRYRRSIQLFDIYTIKTKILTWDSKAIYLQHVFERQKDKFICAVVYINLALLGVTPQDLIYEIEGRNIVAPNVSPELQKWIESNQLSSEKLRKTN